MPVQAVPKAPKPLETRPVGDKAKLLYARAMGPVDAVLNAASNARTNTMQLAAEAMMEWEGLDADEGWRLNVDTLKWERYPKEK